MSIISPDCIETYITDKVTLLEWVKSQLLTGAPASWNSVHIFEGQGWDKVFHFLPQVQMPACVIVYIGTTYAKRPRATVKFSVLVADRNFVDKEAVQKLVLAKIKKVNQLLDHQLYAEKTIFFSKGDAWQDLSGNKTDGITAYKIDIEAEDS